MKTIVAISLLLTACIADPVEPQPNPEPVPADQIPLRLASAICDKLADCRNQGGDIQDWLERCIEDELSYYAGDENFPQDTDEDAWLVCQEYIQDSPCYSVYFRSPECAFGQQIPD